MVTVKKMERLFLQTSLINSRSVARNNHREQGRRKEYRVTIVEMKQPQNADQEIIKAKRNRIVVILQQWLVLIM